MLDPLPNHWSNHYRVGHRTAIPELTMFSISLTGPDSSCVAEPGFEPLLTVRNEFTPTPLGGMGFLRVVFVFYKRVRTIDIEQLMIWNAGWQTEHRGVQGETTLTTRILSSAPVGCTAVSMAPDPCDDLFSRPAGPGPDHLRPRSHVIAAARDHVTRPLTHAALWWSVVSRYKHPSQTMSAFLYDSVQSCKEENQQNTDDVHSSCSKLLGFFNVCQCSIF